MACGHKGFPICHSIVCIILLVFSTGSVVYDADQLAKYGGGSPTQEAMEYMCVGAAGLWSVSLVGEIISIWCRSNKMLWISLIMFTSVLVSNVATDILLLVQTSDTIISTYSAGSLIIMGIISIIYIPSWIRMLAYFKKRERQEKQEREKGAECFNLDLPVSEISEIV